MKWWLSMVLWLGLSAATHAREIENGGTIILRAHYALEIENAGCRTLVIVTSEKELARISNQIQSAEGPINVRLPKSTADMRLRPINNQRLYGHFLSNGRRVLVVTREYAEKNGFY